MVIYKSDAAFDPGVNISRQVMAINAVNLILTGCAILLGLFQI